MRPGLEGIVAGVREVVGRGLGARETAFAAADFLRGNLPDIGILTPEELQGAPGQYVSKPLHAQEEFSVVAVVWQPGSETVVHDHVAWCVFGVLSGNEHETLYRDMGTHLVEIGRADNRPGEVSGFAPPGDIHKVRNTSGEVGVSIHVYGADVVSRGGSSVRRVYDLPVRELTGSR
ncbi:cysteine dioxygenase family protein [Nonomuraea sp. NPDC046570]|uniref:cysteine dioxygenase family protein n=1 Tax=Nonomuraea sp. NPDC046570 TaxID=3155255 RepID=UPI0034113C27